MVEGVCDVLCGEGAEFCSFDVGDVLVVYLEEFYGFHADEFSFSVEVGGYDNVWVFLDEGFEC